MKFTECALDCGIIELMIGSGHAFKIGTYIILIDHTNKD